MHDADAVIAKNDNVRLAKYGLIAPISSNRLKTISGKSVEYKDHCHLNLLLYKLIVMTINMKVILLDLRQKEKVN